MKYARVSFYRIKPLPLRGIKARCYNSRFNIMSVLQDRRACIRAKTMPKQNDRKIF